MRNLSFFLLFIIPVVGNAQESDEAAIRRESAKFSSAYVAGNFEAMASQYTDDAIVLAPGREAIVGRTAILIFWQSTTKPSLHTSTPERIVIEGNLAHDYGHFYTQSQTQGEAARPMSSAKYYILWVKDSSGQWRMKVDMWNSRRPDWNK